MTYFEDLTPYAYLPESLTPGAVVRNVGWLDATHDFLRARAPQEFVDALAHFRLAHRCAVTRGFHSCELCPPTSREDVKAVARKEASVVGSAEIRVAAHDGTWLSAPELVVHYVAEHDYLPPRAFYDAVMAHRPSELCQRGLPGVTHAKALAVAEEFLAKAYPTTPPTIVMRSEWTIEYAWAWRVMFDTQEHIDTGDFMQAPMVRVVVVPKDSSNVRWMPSAFSVAEAEEYCNTGAYPARFRRTAR